MTTERILAGTGALLAAFVHPVWQSGGHISAGVLCIVAFVLLIVPVDL